MQEVKDMTVSEIDLEVYARQRRPQIGQQVRIIRKQFNWTQEQVALYLGCSRRRVNRVEQGITDFTVFELELLAQKFQVPLADLLGYSQQL